MHPALIKIKFRGNVTSIFLQIFVVLFVPLSLADNLVRGKLLSGDTYRGRSYQHILVNEAIDSSRCFKFISTGLRVVSRLVNDRIRTRDRTECEQECLRASFTCRGFNYRYDSFSTNSFLENCELSTQDTYGVNIADTLVFARDRDWDFYERRSFSPDCDRRDLWDATYRYGTSSGSSSWRDLDRNWYDSSDCFRFYQRETRLDPRSVKERLMARDLQECKDSCRRSRSFVCRTMAFSYTSMSSSWFNNYNCYLSDARVMNLDQYDLVYDKTFDLYIVDENNRNCNYYNSYTNGNGITNPYGREEGFETTSGLQCYRTGCQPDRFNRFYFCETNANGGWDYCCRPGERCQLSVGFGLNWCIVGVRDEDAWRPCSMQSLSGRSFLKGSPEEVKKLEEPKQESEKIRPDETKIELRNIEELTISE